MIVDVACGAFVGALAEHHVERVGLQETPSRRLDRVALKPEHVHNVSRCDREDADSQHPPGVDFAF
jgi:hypothetical protein